MKNNNNNNNNNKPKTRMRGQGAMREVPLQGGCPGVSDKMIAETKHFRII